MDDIFAIIIFGFIIWFFFIREKKDSKIEVEEYDDSTSESSDTSLPDVDLEKDNPYILRIDTSMGEFNIKSLKFNMESKMS